MSPLPEPAPADPSFTCREFARAHGLTRQAALTRLNRMLGLGQLVRTGENRSSRYRPNHQGTTPSTDRSPRFWRAVSDAFPKLEYRHVVSVLGTPTPRSRRDARRLLADLSSKSFLVLDFHGVERAGSLFICELEFRRVDQLTAMRWINLSEEVRALAEATYLPDPLWRLPTLKRKGPPRYRRPKRPKRKPAPPPEEDLDELN